MSIYGNKSTGLLKWIIYFYFGEEPGSELAAKNCFNVMLSMNKTLCEFYRGYFNFLWPSVKFSTLILPFYREKYREDNFPSTPVSFRIDNFVNDNNYVA